MRKLERERREKIHHEGECTSCILLLSLISKQKKKYKTRVLHETAREHILLGVECTTVSLGGGQIRAFVRSCPQAPADRR